MDKTLLAIKGQLDQIVALVRSNIPQDQPFGIAHGNWSFPGLTGAELAEEAQAISTELTAADPAEIIGNTARLADYPKRLEFLRTNTIPNIWGNGNTGTTAFLTTLAGLRQALKPTLEAEGKEETVARLRKLQTQLRGMEARYAALEPRTASLNDMVYRIENASDAADQLPTDLVALSEARDEIINLSRTSAADQGKYMRGWRKSSA